MARLNLYINGRRIDSVPYDMSDPNAEGNQNQIVNTLCEKHRILLACTKEQPVFMIEGVESKMKNLKIESDEKIQEEAIF